MMARPPVEVFGLGMPFGEAMERLGRVDPKEIKAKPKGKKVRSHPKAKPRRKVKP
jgi:hypothetical protein